MFTLKVIVDRQRLTIAVFNSFSGCFADLLLLLILLPRCACVDVFGVGRL